jgi:hypothetical protein
MIQNATVKLAGVLMLILLIAAGAMRHQRDQARADLANYRAEVAEATQRAEAQARQTETTLRTEAETLRTKLAKEAEDAKTRQNRLVADIRAGTQRMSIAAACPPAASQAGADSAAAPGNGAEGARAELDPEAAATLVAIAADGDQAIRERNACIAAYDNIRDTLNAR